MNLPEDTQQAYEAGLAIENDLLDALTAEGMYSQNQACRIIALSTGTLQYRKSPRPRTPDPIPHSERVHPARLGDNEEAQIIALIQASTVSIEQTFFGHLNQGLYIASLSSWHRIARKHDLTTAVTAPRNHRGPRPGTPPRAAPVLVASGPGEVVCWDISFLPGFYRGHHFALYLGIDLYSRMILGWTIQDAENTLIARDLIAGILDSTNAKTMTVHSDNGAAMTSKDMERLLEKRGVRQSLIRPGVSNDNAQMESVFRTVKYGPTWPGSFQCLDDASTWFTGFVDAYNQHPHTGLEGFTPQQVYTGEWTQVAKIRQAALDTSYQAHPQRYRHHPVTRHPPPLVSLNLGHNEGKNHTPSTLTALIAP